MSNPTRQLSLGLGEPPAPSLPPPGACDTSQLAAASVAHKTETERARVFGYIAAQGELGATADEIGRALNLLPQSCTPRIYELRKAGAIVDSGRRRPTGTGRLARVYVATERGQRA